MPSSLVNRANIARETADIMVPFFGADFDLTNQSWWVELTEQYEGVVEERAIVHIPHNLPDDYAPAVCLNPDGVLGAIVHDTFVVVKRFFTDNQQNDNYDIAFIGTVHEIHQHPSRDEVIVVCKSLKEKLRDVRLVGSWCWDGDKVVYKRGVDLQLNPGGRPNWTFTPSGTPLMAPNPDWGLGNDGSQAPPSPDEQNSDAACDCTLSMIMEYLRVFHGPLIAAAEDPDVAEAFNYWLDLYPDLLTLRTPELLLWPPGFGANVDAEFIANFDQGVGQNYTLLGAARKGRDMSFGGGIALIGDKFGKPGAFDMIFAAAGAWSYQVVPLLADSGEMICLLKEVPTRPTASQNALPIYYSSGPVQPGFPAVIFEDEHDMIGEDSGSTCSRQLILGSRAKNEKLFDVVNPAWALNTFLDFRAKAVEIGGVNPTPDAIQKALSFYPAVGSRFYIDKDAAAIAYQTAFEDFVQARQNRPILPHLLTFQGGAVTGSGDVVFMPVLVEIETSPGVWNPAPESLGMVIWDNGLIEFQTFRNLGYHVEDEQDADNAQYGPLQYEFDNLGRPTSTGGLLNCSLRAIRFTAAVVLDQPIEAGLVSPFDSAPHQGSYQVDTESWDAQRFRKGFTRLGVTDAKGLYEAWARTETATPVPVSAGGSAPGRATLRDDFTLMQAHNRKNMRLTDRLRRMGALPIPGFLTGGFEVGDGISELVPVDGFRRPWPLNVVIKGKVWTTRKIDGAPMKYANKTEYVIQ